MGVKLRAPLVFAVAIAFAVLGSRTVIGQRGVAVIPVQSPDGSSVGKQWLVLIAIDKYENMPALRACVKDATALRDVLTSRYQFDEVIQLYDEKATREDIVELLRSIAKKTQPEDSVFIYYSGHGDLDQVLQTGFWIPVDGDRSKVTSWIPNDLVKRCIAAFKAKHALLVSDSCFAGDFFSEIRSGPATIDNAYYRQMYAKPSRQALTSGGLQPVVDASADGHSPFAYFLLRALRSNTNPYLVPTSLGERVKEGVALSSAYDQTPLLGYLQGTGSERGEYVLFLKPEQQPVIPKVDTQKPQLSIYEPQELLDEKTRDLQLAASANAARVILRGVATDNEGVTEVRVNNAAVELQPAGTRGLEVVGRPATGVKEFTKELSLASGDTLNVVVEAEDAAGNVARR